MREHEVKTIERAAEFIEFYELNYEQYGWNELGITASEQAEVLRGLADELAVEVTDE